MWDENIPVIRHAVIEGVGIEKSKMEHVTIVENLRFFCKEMDFHIVKDFEYHFMPHGSSIVCILEESHTSVHTWPEKGYLHMDLVTCTKEKNKLTKLADIFESIFNPKSVRVINLKY